VEPHILWDGHAFSLVGFGDPHAVLSDDQSMPRTITREGKRRPVGDPRLLQRDGQQSLDTCSCGGSNGAPIHSVNIATSLLFCWKLICCFLVFGINNVSRTFILLLLYSDLMTGALSTETSNYTVFYKCDSKKGGHAIAIPSEILCSIPDSFVETSITVRVHLWGHNTKPQETQAVKCSRRISSVCTFMGFFASKGVLSRVDTYQPLTAAECLFAWKSKQFDDQKLERISQTTWATQNVVQTDYVWCCATYCKNFTNIIVELGVLSTFDGQSLLSDLGHPDNCSISDKACFPETYVIVWERDSFQTYCPYISLGTYAGKLMNKYVLVEQGQGAFTLNHPVFICGRIIGYQTEQGSLLQIEYQDENSWQPLRPDTSSSIRSTHPNDYDGFATLDSKLQFLYEKIRSIVTYNFRVLWLELCKGSSRYLHLIWQMLRLNPTLGARAFLNVSNIHAEFFGEVLVVWKCAEFSASEFFWNYTVNSRCYTFLPVLIESTIWFVIPGSRDIVSAAPVVDCHLKPAGIHRTTDGCTSNQGPVHVSEPSIQVIWDNRWKPYTFNASPKKYTTAV